MSISLWGRRCRLVPTDLDEAADNAHAGANKRSLSPATASGAGSAGYRYALTDLGRDRAGQYFDISRYVGPAPVPIDWK